MYWTLIKRRFFRAECYWFLWAFQVPSCPASRSCHLSPDRLKSLKDLLKLSLRLDQDGTLNWWTRTFEIGEDIRLSIKNHPQGFTKLDLGKAWQSHMILFSSLPCMAYVEWTSLLLLLGRWVSGIHHGRLGRNEPSSRWEKKPSCSFRFFLEILPLASGVRKLPAWLGPNCFLGWRWQRHRIRGRNAKTGELKFHAFLTSEKETTSESQFFLVNAVRFHVTKWFRGPALGQRSVDQVKLLISAWRFGWSKSIARVHLSLFVPRVLRAWYRTPNVSHCATLSTYLRCSVYNTCV